MNNNYDSNSNYDSNNNYYGPSEPVDPFGDGGNPYNNNNGSNGNAPSEEQQKKASNYANASLALGIYTVASYFICCGFMNLITGILSIVFAFMSKNAIQSKALDSKSKAGVICSIIGLALTVFMVVLFIFVFAFLIIEESGEAPALML